MVFNAETYCALIMLLELTEFHAKKGCLLEEIVSKHRIPSGMMELTKKKLELKKLIIVKRNRKEWIFLSEEPSKVKVLDVIELFTDSFPGCFTCPESGRTIPQNNMLQFLNERCREIEASIRKRWNDVTLEKLYQKTRNLHV